MTTVQRIVQVLGVVFVIIGVAGFFFSSSMDEAAMFGLFPVNILHNIVHLFLGLWALAAARSFAGAKSYAQIVGVIYIALAVLGFVSPDGFGLVPIGGNDIWLHALLGGVLLTAAFTSRVERPPATMP